MEKSLLEQAIENEKSAAQREKTIKQLRQLLDDAKFLKDVIVSYNTPETVQDSSTVTAEIDRLQAFIDSEQGLIRRLDAPSKENVKKVFG